MGKKLWTYGDRAWFDGTIDEVCIYNRALSEKEVKQNFKSKGWAVNRADKLSVIWGDIKVSR